MTGNTCPTSDQLHEFVTGKLALASHVEVERHVDLCAACQETVAILDENSATFLTGLASDSVEAAEDDPDLQQLVQLAKAIAPERDAGREPASLKTWPDAQPQFAPGTVLGNYVLGEPIGGGNMGFVYKAYHKRMKRDVALKFISPALLESNDARRRFQREIEAAAKLNHPNIVSAYDAGETDGYYFLVLELIAGSDLREVVQKDGPLPLGQALRCVLQAARGLQYAHSVGIVHRDIKPANLLLDEQGLVKVADLGLARVEWTLDDTGNDLSRTGIVAGTPAYMAPEQCLDLRQTDHRTDIYSLGCTLFYLLTGKSALQTRGGAQSLLAGKQQPAPSIRAICPECPAEVDRYCQSMMAASMEDRPQSMRHVAGTIEKLLAKFPAGNMVAELRRRRIASALVYSAFAIIAVLLLGVLAQAYVQRLDKSTTGANDVQSRHSEKPEPNARSRADADSLKNTPAATHSPDIQLVRIEPGQFTMGSAEEDSAARADESPRHLVQLTKPFLLGKFEITVAQYAEVMGLDSSELESVRPPVTPEGQEPGRLPVSGLSWLEAVEFCNRLSQRHGLTPFYNIDGETVSARRGNNGYRLPTEAEWEFACRADSQSRWHFGDDPEQLDEFAWYARNSGGLIHPVGTKKPNAFGLYDMHGNVPEWCWDRHDPDYYAESEAIDPPGSSRGESRVFRGGGANNRAEQTRSAARSPLGASYGFFNSVGLRVARSVQ